MILKCYNFPQTKASYMIFSQLEKKSDLLLGRGTNTENELLCVWYLYHFPAFL